MFCGVDCRYFLIFFFFFQAEDGIRDLVRSRGLGDVYKRQRYNRIEAVDAFDAKIIDDRLVQVGM